MGSGRMLDPAGQAWRRQAHGDHARGGERPDVHSVDRLSVAGDPERMTAAHVPDDVSFATKPQIARRMIARAIAAKVPFSFVAADTVYGTGELETALRKAGNGYVLGVAANHVFH